MQLGSSSAVGISSKNSDESAVSSDNFNSAKRLDYSGLIPSFSKESAATKGGSKCNQFDHLNQNNDHSTLVNMNVYHTVLSQLQPLPEIPAIDDDMKVTAEEKRHEDKIKGFHQLSERFGPKNLPLHAMPLSQFADTSEAI